ncbi:hypothetical protein Tco_1004941 [Tanacetum coccineum]|uniref:Uncharacterized protein n=1 Tax=Tanacetum coccineum TaxID=301880 RepID=A0ABQ5FDZ3_9ASTR
METKDTLSSCLDSEQQEMQQMQKQAKSMKQSSINNFNVLKSTFQYLSNVALYRYPIHHSFEYEFGRICSEEFNSFMSTLVHNIDNLAKQLNTEVLHEKDSKYALSVIKRCIDERALHEQEIQKRLNDKKLQNQECKVQEVNAVDASSGDTDSSGYISDNRNAHSSENDCSKTGNDQSLEKQSSTFGNESSRSRNEFSKRSSSGNDTNIKPSYDTEPMAEADQYDDDYEDERVVLANLIANLKLDIDENKTIQKQLRKTNATLTHELNKCKSALKASNDI